MCGICVFLSNNTCQDDKIKIEHCLKSSSLSCRGPDIQNTVEKVLTPSTYGVFYGSTLHFRGLLSPQPLQDRHGNIFLWNGEIFGGLKVSPGDNDGMVLLNLLADCDDNEDLLQLFSKIEGPWTFIYWKARSKQLWFGRDVLGRRSLLYHKEADKSFALASVAIKEWLPWQAVPALGIFLITLDDSDKTHSLNPIILYPWGASSMLQAEGITNSTNWKLFNNSLMEQSSSILDDLGVDVSRDLIFIPIKPFNKSKPGELNVIVDFSVNQNIDVLANDRQRQLADKMIQILQESVRIRTICQSDKCSRCLEKQLSGLCNVNTECSYSGKSGKKANSKTTPMCDKDSEDSKSVFRESSEYKHLVSNDVTFQAGSIGVSDLDTSNSFVNNCDQAPVDGTSSHCGHARVAILFSGGIDSLLIAALADRCVPGDEPIDLLNVAFEQQVSTTTNQRSSRQVEHSQIQSFAVPDRKTGIAGLKELTSLNPNRLWNFVQIDVTLKELQKLRAEHVKDLVYPLHTVLDDSIGCAIWFASRGQGVIHSKTGQSIPYTSPARVVLVGMGADEQLVGYSRHRVIYGSSGWQGLIDAIQLEIERISLRNLGRDDRVISDHGREARFPFLDENLVSFLNQLPLHEKANLNLPKGIGDKFLLRLAAKRVGLKEGATIPKRAIQFGSRIAKAENRKEKGSDNCCRLQE